MRCRLVPLVLAGLLFARGAHADDLDAEISSVVKDERVRLGAEMAKRSWHRFKRSVTLGPTFVIAPGLSLDDGKGALLFGPGLTLVRYDVPSLAIEELEHMLLSAVGDAVRAQLEAARARGEMLSEAERHRIIADTWRRIADELLRDVEPHHLEKPRHELLGEVGYIKGAGSWDVRAVYGQGVGPVFLVAGLGVQYDGSARFDSLSFVLPLEVAVPVLFNGGVHSPGVEFFVRADLVLSNRDRNDDRAFLGARLMLDIF